MITPRQLEIFTAVYEEGNMTAAAKKIHLSQPAISQTVKDIETQYSIKLFERYGSKLFTTEAGKVLYDYSTKIMGLYRDIDNALLEHDGVNEIRVGANISAGTAHIIKLTQNFNDIHPDIEVKTMIFQAPVLIKSLKQNELDLALIEDQKDFQELEDFIVEPYYKDRIVIISSKKHPCAERSVALKDLSHETFLFREKGAGVRDMFDNILKIKRMKVNVGWECTSTEAIVDAVKLNMGIAVVPYLLVKRYLTSGEIKEINITDVWLSRNLNIVYHKDKALTTPLKDFIGLVRKIKDN